MMELNRSIESVNGAARWVVGGRFVAGSPVVATPEQREVHKEYCSLQLYNKRSFRVTKPLLLTFPDYSLTLY